MVGVVVAHQASAHLMRDEGRWVFENGAGAAPARRWARQMLAAWRLPVPLIEDALLVITELVQNVTQHTDAGGELVLILRRGTVGIEVSDPCPDLPQIRPPDPRRIGGRGLPIVAAVCQEWGIRPGPGTAGKTVWALMTTPPD